MMQRAVMRLSSLICTLLVLLIVGVGCGAPVEVEERVVYVDEEVEVTRIVTQEVTRLVETAIDADTDSATSDSADEPEVVVVEVEVTRLVESVDQVVVTQIVEVEREGGFVNNEGRTVADVRGRRVVRCAGNANLVGFGFLNPSINLFEGFDIDFCKAVGAAVFGEGGAEQVEIVPTDGVTRFSILQAGEADVLLRNTTKTISRDTALGFNFGPTTFYDGQGMMVRAASGIESLEDLDGGAVCVQAGTTTEYNLALVFGARAIDIETLVYPDNPTTIAAYLDGVCDGFTTDTIGLIASRSTFDNPTDHLILAETISKEPLGPAWRHGDDNWGDIVTWAVYCTMAAEELGITQSNVDQMLASNDYTIRGLLGLDYDLGTALNLNDDFCYQIIKQVGNYGEIYARHLGSHGLQARGLNALWTEGGLHYAPPFR